MAKIWHFNRENHGRQRVIKGKKRKVMGDKELEKGRTL